MTFSQRSARTCWMRVASRVVLAFILVVIAVVAAVPTHAQTLSLVSVKVNAFQDHSADFYAFDAQNKLVRNLQPADFDVRNSVQAFSVTNVTCPPVSAPERLSVVLCIDVSGSMSQGNPTRMSRVRDAASLFVSMLDTTLHECAITSFDHLSYINQDFTTSKSSLLSAISTLQPQGATDYNNALLAAPTGAMNVATQGRYKRVVIMLTDGDGGGKQDSILAFAQLYNIRLYTIAYFLQAPGILANIASQTGGLLFGETGYESLTTPEQLKAAFRASLVHAEGAQPCTVSWFADKYCYQDWRWVSIAVPSQNMAAVSQYYILPYAMIPYVNFAPASLTYGAVPPGTYQEKTVQIYAPNAPITIADGSFSNPLFTITSWGGSSPPFVIQKGQSRFITVRYTAADTGYQYGTMNIQSNMCVYSFVGASAGYQARSVPTKTISVLRPVGPDNWNSCYYLYSRWDGIAANDSMRIEWTFDDGKTWTMMADNFSGNIEQWFRTPQRTGGGNKIRISHIKFQNDRLQALKVGHPGIMKMCAINPSNASQAVVMLSPDNTYLSTRRAYVVNLQTGDTLATLTPPGGKVVQSVMWSADGSTIILCHNGMPGGQLTFWNASTYQLIRTISDNVTNFTCAAINPAGTRIAVGLQNITNTVRVYDASNGTVLANMNYHTALVNSVAFSGDGSRIASIDNVGRINGWNAVSYTRVNTIDAARPSPGSSVQFHPSNNDQVVAAFQEGVTRIHTLTSGAEVRSYNGNIGAHFYATFNPAGTRVVSAGEISLTGGGYTGTCAVWDASTGSGITTFDGTGKVNNHQWRSLWAGYTADGSLIVTANSFGGVNVWSAAGAHQKQHLLRHAARGAVVSACFFNDDQNAATLGEDGSVVVHTVQTRDTVRTLNDLGSIASKVNTLRASPNGVYLCALAADGTMALWNALTAQLITRIPNAGYGPAFSNNSQYVAITNNNLVQIYVTATGQLYKTITVNNFLSGKDLTYNYDDTRILVAGASSATNMSVVSLNVASSAETGRFTDIFAVGGDVMKLSYAPGSRYVSVYHQSGSRSYVIDSTMTRINTINDMVHAITPNSGYQIGTVLANKQARVWNTANGAVVRTVNPHQGYEVSHLAMSANSSRSIICSHDGNAWLWDFAATPIQSDISSSPFTIGTSILKKKDTINFGKVLNNGSKDSVINQIIMNIGSAWDYIYSVSISGYNKDEFRIVKRNVGLYLYPGQSLTYELGFIPRTKVVGIKQVEMMVVTLCDTLRFVLIGESVNPPTENLVEQIDFGKVEITTRKDTTVSQTIRNVTAAPLNITNTRILGPDTLQFSIVSGGGSFVLAPGESRVITLRFAPTRIARTSARLAFFHPFLGSPATILLAGEGIGVPRISASPKECAMVSPICSALSPIDTVIRVENIGTGVMSIDSAAFVGNDSTFFRVVTSLPDTVTRGGWKNIRIQYLPQMSGQRAAYLRLYTTAANVSKGILDVKVTGQRDTVVLFFPVQNLVLTNVRPFTSVDAYLNLINRGTVPMTLPVPVMLGNFTVVTMSPNPIPPGGTARVYVNFNNGDTSATYDTLYTVRDSCGGLSSVRLRAYTMSPRPTIVILSSLDIISEPCKTFTDTTIIVTNAGMTAMTISDISLVGDTLKQYSIRYKPPQKLESNAVDSIVIRYTPTTDLKQNASLVIRSDAQNTSGGVTTIPLSGTWKRTSFVLDTNRIVLDNIQPNMPAVQTVGLRNTGTAALTWNLPITRGRSTITAITPNPTPVGSTATATVRFSGAPSGTFSIDTLFVRDQCDKGQELRVQVQVQTTRPLIRIRTMPTVTLPCIVSQDTFIIIDNGGLDTLRIDSVTVEQPAGVRITVLGFFPRRIMTFRRDTVYLRIDASGAGSVSQRLTPRVSVYSNSERDSVYTQPFTLNINKSDLRFATATFALPKQKIYRSTTQPLGVTNTGMVPMRFATPIVRGRFSIDSVSPNPLAAGGTGTAYVRFAGDTVGFYKETFRITDSCGNTHTLDVTVEVAPVVPAHLQTLQSVDISEQCYTAIDTTVLITNTGAEDLDISRIYLRGANADEFAILTDTAMVLIPDGTHLVLVRHTSKGVTGLRTAELVMVSNTDSMVNKETVVNLRVMKDSVDVRWEFNQLHLGIVDRNTQARGTIQITNYGTMPQTVSLPLAGKYAVIDSIVPYPILPGSTSVAYVTLNIPDSVGAIKETLTFMNPCVRAVQLEVAAQIRGNAELTTPDTTVMIGDEFLLPILLSDPRGVKLSGVESIRIDLRWNVTMMQLLGVENATLQSTAEDGIWRTCRIVTNPINGTDKAIATLKMQAALGNDTVCTVEFRDIYNSRGITDLIGRGGRVTIGGHCHDGDTRLMDRSAPTAVRAVYPNPASDDVTLAFTTAERAPVSVILVDVLGRTHRVVYQGMPPAEEWTVTVPVADIPSGVYQVVLQTQTQRRSHRLEIHK